MSIMYVKLPKKSPKDKTVKFYPQVKTIKMVKQKEVAKLLAEETTLNPMEAVFVLEQLSKIVQRLLLSSYSVQLGEWLSFHLTSSSEGSDTLADCTAQKIKQLNVRCRFGEEFRQGLKNGADFKLVKKLEVNEGE